MRRAPACLLAAALLIGCAENVDPDVALAQEVCADLQSATTPIERRVAEKRLLGTVGGSQASEGADFGAVVGAMKDECPEETSALLDLDQLDHQVELTVDSCEDNEASGTVTNGGDTTVTVHIAVRVVDDEDTLLDTSSTTVRDLEPGQRGEWEAYHSEDSLGFTCKGEIDQVTPG